jgi:hypothetical protein
VRTCMCGLKWGILAYGLRKIQLVIGFGEMRCGESGELSHNW